MAGGILISSTKVVFPGLVKHIMKDKKRSTPSLIKK